MKILFIEDDPVLSNTIASVLSDRYEFTITSTLRSGVETLTAEPFDLILLDIGLPCVSVDEVIFSIKELHKIAPVVVLTGQGDELMAVQAINMGAKAFCRKPISVAELIEEIEKARLSYEAKQQQIKAVEDVREAQAAIRTMINGSTR